MPIIFFPITQHNYTNELLRTSSFICPITSLDIVDNEVLLHWVKEQIKEHEDLSVNDVASVFRDGRILSAILSHYRPDLLDYSAMSPDDPVKNNQTAIDLLEKEIGKPDACFGHNLDFILSFWFCFCEI